ncbi:MAG: hypothetical protein GY708_21625 [Actinomycetia bacterium]|nr:hypothetical protein [Actinomycetes bacterium]
MRVLCAQHRADTVGYVAQRRGFGTVRKLPSGRWQGMYTDPETGKRVTGPTTFLTKGDANRWLSTVETDLRRGDLPVRRVG